MECERKIIFILKGIAICLFLFILYFMINNIGADIANNTACESLLGGDAFAGDNGKVEDGYINCCLKEYVDHVEEDNCIILAKQDVK